MPTPRPYETRSSLRSGGSVDDHYPRGVGTTIYGSTILNQGIGGRPSVTWADSDERVSDRRDSLNWGLTSSISSADLAPTWADVDSNGSGEMQQAIAQMLASQRRLEQRFEVFEGLQKDVSKVVLEIRRIVSGVEHVQRADQGDHAVASSRGPVDNAQVPRPSNLPSRTEARLSVMSVESDTQNGTAIARSSQMVEDPEENWRRSVMSIHSTIVASTSDREMRPSLKDPDLNSPEDAASIRSIEDEVAIDAREIHDEKAIEAPVSARMPRADPLSPVCPDDGEPFADDCRDINAEDERPDFLQKMLASPVPSSYMGPELHESPARRPSAYGDNSRLSVLSSLTTQSILSNFLGLANDIPQHIRDNEEVGRRRSLAAWRPPPSLPHNWPGCINLHKALDDRKTRHLDIRSLLVEDTQSVHGHDMLELADSITFASTPRGPDFMMMLLRPVLMRPMSTRRVFLDILGIFILGYDLFATPFVLAWDIEITGTLKVLAWSALCFWMIDVLASFSTGFYKEGVLEMRPNRIAGQYLRSWFGLDVVIIACDWFSLLSPQNNQQGTEAVGVLRFSKLSRLVRIVTVLRLVRLADISVRLTDWGITQRWAMVADIIKLLVAIIWISHLSACAWYALGVHASSDTGGRWLAAPTHSVDGLSYRNANVGYQYFTSLHWVLAQITPGSMSVQPLNTVERIFNVICLLCGLFFFTSLVSSLSTKMVHFRMMKQEEAMLFVRLRKYLQQEGIGQQLAVIIQKQLRDRLLKQKLLTWDDVPAIDRLPLSTRMELHFEVCKPFLRHYPFFHLWANIDVHSFRKFCFKAVSFQYLPHGETLFLPGSIAQDAFHVCDGELDYYPETAVHSKKKRKKGSPGTMSSSVSHEGTRSSLLSGSMKPQRSFLKTWSRQTEQSNSPIAPSHSNDFLKGHNHHPLADIEPRVVQKGTWLCEGALWTQWIHVGTAIAVSRCKLMTCNGVLFVKELMSHRLTRPIAKEYGISYHARLIRAFPPHADLPPDDLHVPHTTPEEIILCMENEIRTFVSSIAFNTIGHGSFFKEHQKVHTKFREKLGHEVLQGKTVLTFDPGHTVKRVVQLSIAVISCDENETILVQIGKEEGGSGRIRFGAVFPGIKQVGKETPSETTCRLLETLLKPLLPGLTPQRTYLETEYKVSSRYNLQTSYLRTVQEMSISTSFLKKKRPLQYIKPLNHSVHSSTPSITAITRQSSVKSSASDGQLTLSMRSSIYGDGTTKVRERRFLRHISRPRNVLKSVIGYTGDVDPGDIVDKLQMFILRDDEGAILCAWMSRPEFAVLADPGNEQYMAHLFSNMSIEANQ